MHGKSFCRPSLAFSLRVAACRLGQAKRNHPPSFNLCYSMHNRLPHLLLQHSRISYPHSNSVFHNTICNLKGYKVSCVCLAISPRLLGTVLHSCDVRHGHSDHHFCTQQKCSEERRTTRGISRVH
ncbi:hypothetical protein BS17DRAFT_23321 [Gyrodon lividus]|nr:hypothetical protein BS17DRAFT_23321 [Gyrodon lividus]